MIVRLFVLTTLTRQIEESMLKAKPMTHILSERAEIIDTKDASELLLHNGAVELNEVSFEYVEDKTSERVFSNLKLSIKPGEKVGLIGPSGGGKTTFTRLLLRFDDIQSGIITIDGQNIAEVTQHSLRSNIGYVPQEPLLFHRTVKENIAYGKLDATDNEIRQAAKAAHALEFIESLPKGFDTIVGERGIKLSGGQRQRVAIARAMLKNAPILLLDEATSALDSESEQLVQSSLDTLMKHKTAIVIAHRLSTIQKMDRIIVLDDGKIVEQGSHTELLKNKKGLYTRLWKHQSGGFLTDD
jgi:ATP-binding cassette subfamily B protein